MPIQVVTKEDVGDPVTQAEIASYGDPKCTPGRNRWGCNGTGFVTILGSDEKPDDVSIKRQGVCPCAMKRFAATHPYYIVDKQKNLFWPKDREAAAEAYRRRNGQQGQSAATAERDDDEDADERLEARVERLLDRRAKVQEELREVDERIAKAVEPFLEKKRELEARVAEVAKDRKSKRIAVSLVSDAVALTEERIAEHRRNLHAESARHVDLLAEKAQLEADLATDTRADQANRELQAQEEAMLAAKQKYRRPAIALRSKLASFDKRLARIQTREGIDLGEAASRNLQADAEPREPAAEVTT